MDIYFLGYASIGLLAGLLAGLLGIGGGLVMVPALMILFQYQGFEQASLAHIAIGSSLIIIIPTAMISTLAHHRKGAVDWQVMAHMTPGLLAGALTGALLADQMHGFWLQRFFGLFLLLVSSQMLLSKASNAGGYRIPGRWVLGVAATGIGIISGLLGIGGGTMTVPMLVRYGKPLVKAVATSAACGLPIALAGGLGFILFGEQEADFSSGYVYWPAVFAVSATSMLTAPWGAVLAHKLPVASLKMIFALMLVVVGLKLLLG